MKYRILYKTILWSAALLLATGCTKELPADEGLPEDGRFTRIVFNTSGFTKADKDLHVPTTGNEDGIKSLVVYGIAWADNSIVNIFHVPGKNPIQGEPPWGEIRGDTAVIRSSLFERDRWGYNVEYVNLYAIANIDQLDYIDKHFSFDGYNSKIANWVTYYRPGRTPIPGEAESDLKNLIVSVKNLSTALEYPLMAQTMQVKEGASYIHMSLERVYCRIGFSFLFTGNSGDKIKINQITIDKTSDQSYLFLEENSTGTKPLGSLVWSADKNGPGAFKDAKGNTFENGKQSTGGALVTLYAASGSIAPLYFRTCQYLCDKEAQAPSITLDIMVFSGGDTKSRTLTAPLFSSGGADSKKHYGFLRNHSYQVISTVNTDALKLENVAVEMRDWNDRPPVDIPEFK